MFQLVSYCPTPFLGAPVFLDNVVYMFLVLYWPLCSTFWCCIAFCSSLSLRGGAVS